MKKHILLAMLCGICAALALPPFFYLPLTIVAFSGLYLLLTKAENLKQSFWLGWSFGFAHHVVGLYWISNALLTDPERFAWMVPFAISLIPAALAIYIGLVAVVHRYIVTSPHLRIVAFAAIWTISEWLRGHLFTGFPWNLMGYALNIHGATMQAASIIGVYGLSFCLVLAATAPALLQQRKYVFVAVCSLLLPVLITGFGVHRLVHAKTEFSDTPIHLVQANISQNHKWDESLMMEGLIKNLTLSQSATRRAIIIWPETAIPYFLHEDERIRKTITQALGDHMLISGSLRIRRLPADDFDIWNSLEVMQNSEIKSFYLKNKLVPFGEYVPLKQLFPFVEKITHGAKDFSHGEGAQVLHAPGLPDVSPLICYEIIYPGYVSESGSPKWLLNVTNDAWFGDSSGPHQHFEMARMRAVEQGVPLVRVANTGISAVIDPYGRVVKQLPLNSQGTINASLPLPLSQKTLYFRLIDSSIF